MIWLYSITILLGSALLFVVQPLCAKMLLPLLGGTPAAWNTCMVFFQAGLLLGYAYAHAGPRWLGVLPHGLLHIGLLIGAFFLLPIQLTEAIPDGVHPIGWLLLALTLAVGLPFTVLSAQATLLQRWYVARDPYFLYSASNIGSFLGLAAFPFLLEPYLPLPDMSEWWRWGFLACILLTVACVPWRAPTAPTGAASEPAPTWTQRGRWIVLALIPSSLLLSVTTYLTTDVAAIPLLWLIPMALYLLTFTLVFAQGKRPPHALFVRWLPLIVIVLIIVQLREATQPMLVVMAIHLIGFFWLAMVCHGALANSRPAATHLTDFYLCLAVGGVLGGVLNALVAPIVFSALVEYPLMIALACVFGLNEATQTTRTDWLWALGMGAVSAAAIALLQPWHNLAAFAVIVAGLVACYLMQERPARFALGIAAMLLTGIVYQGEHGTPIYAERSYFGIHRVTQIDGLRRLVHGSTVHGQQGLDPDRRMVPLTYYSQNGPIGDVITSLKGDPRLNRVGVIGLGAGTLACYADKGQDWTFFEIDPSVERIADNPNLFTFLHDARQRGATIRVEIGDGRVLLDRSPKKFGLFIVDAFGSDAIPVHLLTREALRVCLDHLEPDGVLAFHISNNYVDLEPVLANLARDADCVALIRRDKEQPEPHLGIMASHWLVIARHPDHLKGLVDTKRWDAARPRANVGVWTDGYSNLWRVFRW